MLINVSTRRFGRAVCLPEGDVPSPLGDSRPKSAVSRRFWGCRPSAWPRGWALDLS